MAHAWRHRRRRRHPNGSASCESRRTTRPAGAATWPPPLTSNDSSPRCPSRSPRPSSADEVDGRPVVPWLRAVEADGELAGFVMLAERTAAHLEAYLWRCLIDRRHQRRGVGDRALDARHRPMRSRGPRHAARQLDPRAGRAGALLPRPRVRADRARSTTARSRPASAADVTSRHRHQRSSSMATRYTAPLGGRSRYCAYLATNAASADVGGRIARLVDHGAAPDAHPPQAASSPSS